MMGELAKSIKSIDKKKLSENDKKELLIFFFHTNDSALRNEIAFIFSDIKYHQALPYILLKIKNYNLNDTGSLIYSLKKFITFPFFADFVEILCTATYEARLMAYEIIKKDLKKITLEVKYQSLRVLDRYSKQELSNKEDLKNSTGNFIEQTKTLIEKSLK